MQKPIFFTINDSFHLKIYVNLKFVDGCYCLGDPNYSHISEKLAKYFREKSNLEFIKSEEYNPIYIECDSKPGFIVVPNQNKHFVRLDRIQTVTIDHGVVTLKCKELDIYLSISNKKQETDLLNYLINNSF
ncbi:MAG: hypothetical protein K9L02_03840 [Acholeplasmataceae bacterium]|nr:hypothetical protein [Acholeplasmataceae bacterium]